MSNKNKILNRDKEKQKLIKEINRAQLDVKTAQLFFEYVSDPELVDVAIYELEAKKSRYRYLIKVAKEKGIKRSLQESLIEAMAK
ncbi:DUF2508 family protein [Romboutsia sedimentorum]|uniref:DUF2508 family protein n=1 Tax=Romboutsia sedimentorum TaxID=1368474 RepID=A0ABT7EDS9_9FIRM|nr:DUF2508 family protein [Romboutsia sedimentorum]MDK2565092.1 DUF2508 family protein [Romboutsia sedimentorum]MDK2587551.1 DUF2508 family protein [Romboutsia sedimentorum]